MQRDMRGFKLSDLSGDSWGVWQALYNYQMRDALSHVVRGQEATF